MFLARRLEGLASPVPPPLSLRGRAGLRAARAEAELPAPRALGRRASARLAAGRSRPGLQLSAFAVALALHGALLAGGLVFDWFGAGAAKEATVTALVTLIPAAKPEAALPPAPALKDLTPPLVLPPVTRFAVDEPLAAVAPITQPAPSAALAGYLARLAAHLERHKRYPEEARRRRAEGEALVRFTLDRAGHVLSFTLVRSSGVPALDAEIAALLARAAPFPPMPEALAQARLTVELPIGFSLRRAA